MSRVIQDFFTGLGILLLILLAFALLSLIFLFFKIALPLFGILFIFFIALFSIFGFVWLIGFLYRVLRSKP